MSSQAYRNEKGGFPPGLRADAARAAEDLLSRHWGGNLPVEPRWIAKVLGIEVVTTHLDENEDGKIEKRPGQAARIYLEASDPEVRQRFSCAHELGHFIHKLDVDFELVLHRNKASSTGEEEDEVFANAFAASLLMPEEAVRMRVGLRMTLKQLAREFRVSREAMAHRLKSLGLEAS